MMKWFAKLLSLVLVLTVAFGTFLPMQGLALTAPIVVTNSHTIDRSKSSDSERYANSLQLTLADISNYIQFDSGITRSGNTFTNTLTTAGGASNRYIRLGVNNGAGIINFTALNGSSGQVGAHIQAGVNVSNTTNGMYVYMKDDLNDSESYVTSRQHINWQNHTSPFNKLFALETTLWNVNQAYIEILLPYQASITINNIYLFVEKEVPGFGDMHTRITGGTGATSGNIHTVTNASQFAAALSAVHASSSPSIIRVNGTISYTDAVSAGITNKYFSTSKHNLTIQGVGTSGIIDGMGLKLDGHNTIIENITFRNGQAIDAVQVNGATDSWIRNNTFNGGGRDLPEGQRYDELMSIKNESQFVIVSWNHFKDSNRVLLVGSNDGVDALPDRRLIMHHNYFETVTQRVPLYRGGHAHIYNNYFKNVNSYAIGPRFNSKLKIENNYFQSTNNPITTDSGLYQISGNIYDSSTGNRPTSSTISNINFKNYSYSLDPASSVPSIVMNGAGAGKTSSGGSGNDLNRVIEAEDYTSMSGVQKETSSEGGQNIGFIHNGDHVRFNGIKFGTEAPTELELRVAGTTTGANIEVRLGSVSGTLAGVCPISTTGGWQTWQTQSCFINGPTGTHDLFLVFTGPSGYLFNLNWFQFTHADYVKIQNVGTGLYVDGIGHTANGSNAGQWSNGSSSNQRWTLEKDGSNWRIKNVGTGLYLDGMGRTTNGQDAGQWSGSSSANQRWTLEIASGNWKIKNAATGLYLDGMGRTTNGDNLGQYSSGSSTNQQWKMTAH